LHKVLANSTSVKRSPNTRSSPNHTPDYQYILSTCPFLACV
jgi:hypothetical protein